MYSNNDNEKLSYLLLIGQKSSKKFINPEYFSEIPGNWQKFPENDFMIISREFTGREKSGKHHY